MSESSGRYRVPIGIEIASQWAWRVVIIAIAGGILVAGARYFSELTVPIAVALLGTALAVGGVDWLVRHKVPRIAATFAVMIALLVGIFGMLTLVGRQLAGQFDDLRASVVQGISEIQTWAHDGPLKLSDAQLANWINQAKQTIASSDTSILTRVTDVGTTLTHLVAGFFIVLFAMFFFLYEGDRIWRWVVALCPRDAREKIDSSGRAAWGSLTAFVRATVLVALTDALGIALSAWILGVPLTFAIGVIVFLGAFVPIIGALLSGLIAVLVALVAQGPWTALLMLAAVIAVQQLESHILQPFLMGRLVSVHPLAIILAIAGGVVVAGVVGALIAVPLAACANSVVRHLANAYVEIPPDPAELPPTEDST